MDTIKVIAYLIFMALFIFSLVISFKFQWGKEGKDERGQKINNAAYMAAFPVFPIGWLLTSLFSDYVHPLDYELYKWMMWILVVGAFIVHGMMILILKRRA